MQFAKVFTQVLKFNPVLAIAAAMMALLALAKKVLEQVNKIREKFGLTAMNAAKVAGSIRLANFQAKRFLLDSEQVKASYEALAKTFGQLNHQTVQFSVEVARVARNSGLTADSTAELLASITAATGQSKDLALNSINTLASFARPRLLFADEPTTGLDVTVERQLLDNFFTLVNNKDMTLIIVTHDLGIVAQYCDEAIVMNKGTIVEKGSVEKIFLDPEHEYTQKLIKASSEKIS